MKKALIILGIAVFLLLAGTWIFIPKKLKVTSSITYHASAQGVFDFLIPDSNWKKWWPEKTSSDITGLRYSGYDFHIEKTLYQIYELNIKKNKTSLTALMKIISLTKDSTGIEFSTEINTGMNPLNRISIYFKAKKIKEVFDSILTALASYTKNVKNVYGFDIHNEKVQMQYLLSASKEFDHYPSTQDVYSIIEKIKAYLRTTDGKEEFSPMLNIETKDGFNYLARVGLPVNKKLPGTKEIAVKQMVKNGNILVTEVTGDRKAIEHALKQTEKYISDYQRSIIAIPFQSLETDRLKVTDSTKWITKIFYPVV